MITSAHVKMKQIFFALSVLLLLAGCTAPETPTLADVVVEGYQGENFSSIHDFRENSIKGPQYVDKNSYRLKISGLVEETKKLTYDEVLARQSYKKPVTLNCVEGWSVHIMWEGVLIKDVLSEVQIKPEANTIIFYAVDGYSTSFPLSYVIDNDIMMAFKMNDIVLPAERGFPFQLVAEQKWGYKWIKWIKEIKISDNENYRGYWETRGYNQNGSLDGPKREA